MPRSLTPRQRSIRDFISSATRDNGVPPSYREIAAHFGITVGGLQKQIKALETKGVLRRPAERSARGLQVVAGQEIAGQVRLPILGVVRAGVPVEAVESVEGHLVVDPAVSRGADFVLRVRGESMDPDMKDGDLALVRRSANAEDGQVVIAHVDEDEATVKLFRRKGKEVWLEASNPKFGTITGRPFKVVGQVVGLVRSYARR